MTRTQFPVVAGFALTVNKAQGLTIKEGVVIHLAGSKRFRPASKHGLPFVAFTRSENFAMAAFKNLPPFNDFLKGKESSMLRMRQAFVGELGCSTGGPWPNTVPSERRRRKKRHMNFGMHSAKRWESGKSSRHPRCLVLHAPLRGAHREHRD